MQFVSRTSRRPVQIESRPKPGDGASSSLLVSPTLMHGLLELGREQALMEESSSAAKMRASRRRFASIFRVMLAFILAPVSV